MKLFYKKPFLLIFAIIFFTNLSLMNIKADENDVDLKQKLGLEFFYKYREEVNTEQYGGAYFDEQGNLVLQYKMDDQMMENRIIQQAIAGNSVRLTTVAYSYKELKNYTNLLINNLQFDKMSISALDIDIVHNKVQIYVKSLSENVISSIASMIPIDAVDFIETEIIHTYDIEINKENLNKETFDSSMLNSQAALTLAAGQKLKWSTTGTASLSMFLPGLQWSNSSNVTEYGFMTAGHITASVGSSIYDADNNLIGTVSKKVETDNIDIAYIKRNPNYTFNCTYLDGSGTWSTWSLEEDYGMPVNTNIKIFSYLGNVTGKLVSNNYTAIFGNEIWGNMIRTTANTASGYSGAPVAVDDPNVSSDKIVIGYHKGRAVIDNITYAFHGNMYYIKMNDLSWGSAGTSW